MKKGIQLFIVSLLFLPALTGCSKEKMELSSKEVTVEYGKAISTDSKDYLRNDEDFLKDVTVEGIPDNEKEKQYPSVGEYDLFLKYKDTVEKVKVVVKDSVAPAFKDVKDKYEVSFGSKLDTKDIKAEDLSAVTITLDDKDVNYQKAGEYKATVIAKDTSGNETKKEISIVVKEEEKKEIVDSNKKTNSSKSTTTSSNNTTASSKQKPKNNSSSGSSSSSSNQRAIEARNEARRVVNKVAPSSMSDYDRAKAICKYLYNNVGVQADQSNAAYKKNHGNEAYGALILKKAACSGFSNAVTMMCEEAGIPSRHLNKNQWIHQWNQVKVQGKWVILDAQGGMFGMTKHPLQQANETQDIVQYTDVNGNNAFIGPDSWK